jgi:hypothetical protein
MGKIDIKNGKNILIVAIALQFLSLFFNIWVEEDSCVTGFLMIDADSSDISGSPVPGILSVIWIGINVFICRKDEFKTNGVYVSMSFMNFVVVLFFLFVVLFTDEVYYDGLDDTLRHHSGTGMYMISSSFVLYTVAYIMLSIKTSKS